MLRCALVAAALVSLAFDTRGAPQCVAVPPPKRMDCGHPGITKDECLTNKDCCYGPYSGGCSSAVPCCFWGPGPPPPPPTPPPPIIHTVHVVQSCHLDVGFADTCAGILNRYFDSYYAEVVATAANLTKAGGPERLTFMTFPYLISIFMDCPEYPGLHCPTSAAKAEVRAALQRGDLWLAGFPHSGEPATFDAATLEAALAFSRNVSVSNGARPSATYSQRDVPGLTRSVVPIFARNGISIVSVGANGMPEAPIPLGPGDTAPVFRWAVDGHEVFVLFHRGGYGGDGRADCHIAAGEALCPDWKGDNSGPRSEADIRAQWAKISAEFPNATVRSATFDDFLPALQRANASGSLPVITDEIGDTWIHGMQSDPFKTRAMRAMMRARTACVGSGACDPASAAVANFTRLLMKNGEHTWGKDVKSYLGRDHASYMGAWSNAELADARKTKSNFKDMEASWREQRLWGIHSAVEALGDLPIASEIAAQLLPATPPRTAGLQATDQRAFNVSGWSSPVTFAEDGAIVISEARLASFSYRSYSAVDMSNFVAQYRANRNGSTSPECGDRDFCKPGMPTSAKSALWKPTLTNLYVGDASSSTRRFVLELKVAPEATEDYGAPASVTLGINITGNRFEVTVVTVDKTPTRLPEAAFVSFAPGAGGAWSNEVLGTVNSATAVVAHGSSHLHASDAMLWQGPGPGGGSLRVESLDAGLLCYGEPTAFPTPFAAPDLALGASWNLWNNIWGTNYPQWYPFDPADANLEFRFKFNYTGAASRSAAPPAKPTWPSTFFAQFQEFHAGGNGQGSEGAYALDANYVDNATNIRGGEFIARGGTTLDPSCSAVNPGSACDTIVVAGQRYLSFEDDIPGTQITCCRCCSWKNGCGPLMPKWTENCSLIGTKIVRGEPCYSYAVPGTPNSSNSSLSVRVSDGMICDLDNAGRDFFEFIPASYSPTVPSSVSFQVPANCGTWCGSRGACKFG